MKTVILPGARFWTLALVLTAGTGVCQATYIVNTFASATANESGYIAAYGYNYNLNPLSPNNTPAGFTSLVGCSGYCGYTGSGSMGNGTATAASDSINLSYNIPVDELGHGPYSATANAHASANLANGTLGVSVGGTYEDRGDSGQAGGAGNAAGILNDVLHFHVAGASSNTTTLIGVTYTLDGNFTIVTPAGDSQGSLTTLLHFANGYAREDMGSGPNSYTPAVTGSTASGWVSDSFLVNTPEEVVFSGVYQLVGSDEDIPVQTYLTALCGLGTNCDYSHTAAIGLVLTPNVTYTSDSGVFLTQANVPAAVPEPASLALLSLGASFIFVLRKRGVSPRGILQCVGGQLRRGPIHRRL